MTLTVVNVITLGRIGPEKNAHLAIDAAKQAGVTMILAGEVFDFSEHQRDFRSEIVPRKRGIESTNQASRPSRGGTNMRLLLVRHAHVDAVGNFLAGRMPGVGLSRQGMLELTTLVSRCREHPVRRVYSSPLERARATAEALAREQGAGEVAIADGLNEFDFGDWTGASFSDLEADPRWRLFNEFRAATRVPGGEMMLEVQARAMASLVEIADAHPGETVAAVSHCDVIRAVVCYLLGVPIEHFHRLKIDPASVTSIDWNKDGWTLEAING